MAKQTATLILKQSGLKQTAGRVALLEILLQTKKPLSHKEICAALSDLCYDPVSVYRSLETFQEAGFVHTIEGDNRSRLFALCTAEESDRCHPHFFCRKCGKCECLRNYELPAIARLDKQYIVEEQRYSIKGICNSCKIMRGADMHGRQ